MVELDFALEGFVDIMTLDIKFQGFSRILSTFFDQQEKFNLIIETLDGLVHTEKITIHENKISLSHHSH